MEIFEAREIEIQAERGNVRITIAEAATIELTTDEAAELAQAIATAVAAAESM